jgi:uncharacterized protein (DUF2267 family)
MNEDELIGRLLQRGFTDRGAAVRALHATLGAFAGCLTTEEATAFSRSFAGALAERARRTPGSGEETCGAEALYETVQKRANVPGGVAREHAQLVLRLVSDGLAPDVRTRLLRTLPQEVGALLSLPDEGAPGEHKAPGHTSPLTTLASGKPGSHHPVSEAHADRAQSHSVAKEANPHADSKLSSAAGLTQERLGDALASGRAGPARPISEAKDEEEKP